MKTSFSSELTTPHLATADLACFLESCETAGLRPNDFDALLLSILDHVIENAAERRRYLPPGELEKALLFLRKLETFLKSIQIG